jgi:hypothetical protein
MSWTITGTQRYQPAALLDRFPGAAAAYSLRNLVGTSNPAVVRVRRDNDDAEDDFTAIEVSDGTLATWVGAGNNGFVRTWYDQSGNNQHLNQATNSAQPLIVSNGAVVSDDGKPAVQTNGTSHYMQSPNGALGSVTSFYIAAVGSITASDNRSIFAASNGGYTSADQWIVIRRFGGALNFRHARLGVNTNIDLTDTGAKSLFQCLKSETSLSAWVNSENSTTTVPSTALNLFAEIDFRTSDNAGTPLLLSPGLTQELIAYATDQSTNRAAIEANINAHYSIF